MTVLHKDFESLGANTGNGGNILAAWCSRSAAAGTSCKKKKKKSVSFISIHHHLNRYQAPIWNIPLLLCNIIYRWSADSFQPHAWVFHSIKNCRRDESLVAPTSPAVLDIKYNYMYGIVDLFIYSPPSLFASCGEVGGESCSLNSIHCGTHPVCSFDCICSRIVSHKPVGVNVLL